MSDALWNSVDDYINAVLVPPDAALDAALRDSAAAGLPPIAVSPAQGKLLFILAQIQGAKRVLEIGTLGGYSTIWLARGIGPEGHVITLEADPRHAEVARRNIDRAGLAAQVDIRIGPALDTLPKIAEANSGPFDLFFIDADKVNNPNYFDWALRLSRSGSVIITDNVIRSGRILDATSSDADIQGTRRLYERLSQEKRVTATAIQTVGSKGHDGFAIARVIA